MNTIIKGNLLLITTGLWMLIAMFFAGCEDDKEIVTPANETGTVTDVEGNVYRTVKIGNQWWMAENLKVAKYKNGELITDGKNFSSWGNGTAAFCIYDNSTVGNLYNWYAVNDANGLAPEGWHIPSDEEWKELEKNLGMSPSEADKLGWRGTDQAEKLKIEALKGWERYEDLWPLNTSGFSATAGGCRFYDDTWGSPGLFSTGFWWSVNENSAEDAWYRHLDYKKNTVFRYYGNKDYGFSIRCVKD